VDWAKVGAGYFAVVDPLDPSGILYLTEKEYKIQLRVQVSQDAVLAVLARAGEVPEASQKTKTPHSGSLGKRAWYNTIASYFRGWNLRGHDLMVSLPAEKAVEMLGKWTNIVHIWAGGAIRARGFTRDLSIVSRYLVQRSKTQGIRGTVILLKGSLFYLNSFLMGEPIKDPWRLGFPIAVDRSGLPRWLPVGVRSGLRDRSLLFIRVYTTMLNSYKAFIIPGCEPDFSSIESPHPEIDPEELLAFESFCRGYWSREGLSREGHILELKPPQPIAVRTAGPNGPVSMLAAGLDTLAWEQDDVSKLTRIWDLLPEEPNYPKGDLDVAFLSRHGLLPDRYLGKRITLRELFDMVRLETKRDLERGDDRTVHLRKAANDRLRDFGLGKLSLKFEAAGKVRIFAIVDYWTQCSLRPIHDYLFGILRRIPQDATFNQEGATESFAAEGHKDVYSYDLKSATDLIPLELYKAAFRPLFGEPLVEAWFSLLTDRSFRYFPDPQDKQVYREYRYTRGQPMGAYSSWGALAVLHHLLVLYAARRSHSRPTYRVLGDDVVIAGQGLAEAYIGLTRIFSIPVGLAKSYVSHQGGFNFANQTWVGNLNVSPLSLCEELMIRGPNSRLELAFRAIRRGWAGLMQDPLRFARIIRLFASPGSYKRIARALTKGVLPLEAGLALVFALMPVPARLQALGIKDLTFNAVSKAYALGARVLGKEQEFLVDEIALNDSESDARDIFVNHSIARITKLVKRGSKAASSSFSAWETLSTRLPFSVYLIVLMTVFTKVHSDIVHLVSLDNEARWHAALAREFTFQSEEQRSDCSSYGKGIPHEAYEAQVEVAKKVPIAPPFKSKKGLVEILRPNSRSNDLAVKQLLQFQESLISAGLAPADLESLGLTSES
jgi:hypothetical protein